MQCDDNAMTFTASGDGFTQLLVDRGKIYDIIYERGSSVMDWCCLNIGEQAQMEYTNGGEDIFLQGVPAFLARKCASCTHSQCRNLRPSFQVGRRVNAKFILEGLTYVFLSPSCWRELSLYNQTNISIFH